MADLTSRLRSIVRGPGTPVRELTYEPEPRGYEALAPLSRVGEILGGSPVEGPDGACLAIDRRYEADRFHGDVRVGECGVDDGEALRLLDTGLGEAEAGDGRVLFLDLETTGLSGGAGTLAFLVGCGYFDCGAFQVRQFLLPSHAAERALLAAVADFVGPAGLIVTYNGKAFDVPVMETRWLFHRLPPPFAGKPHFDMLHPARRFWRDRPAGGDGWPAAEFGQEDSGCSLVALERALLGVRRAGDVPGFEIPSRYFRFLRTGDARPLEPVLEHNRLDLISLAAVTARALALVRGGAAACRDARERLALGRIYERAGRYEEAAACYRRAAEDPGVREDALHHLALRLRRERRYVEAAEVWRDLLALGPALRRPALNRVAAEALAIHHEHRVKDLGSAQRFAVTALRAADGPPVHQLEHRMRRLERKLAKGTDSDSIVRTMFPETSRNLP